MIDELDDAPRLEAESRWRERLLLTVALAIPASLAVAVALGFPYPDAGSPPLRLAAEAHERDTLRRGWLDQQQLDERRGLEQQLSHARELARRRGIDVRNDVRVIERRIASNVRKATRQDAA